MPTKQLANAIRALAMDAVEAAKSGHPGMPMGMADVATVLFSKHLKFDASAPDWHDRDRFVLSAGHGSMLIYALTYLTGYDGMDLEQIRNFRQLGYKTAGHPEYGHAPGVETTTGPLGQGLATAVGMAIAERHLNARFGDDLVDHHTYVVAGDGCLMEGISQEAISLAGHLKLSKLIVLFDDNGISIDGAISLSDSTDQLARFAASGWNTIAVDGHNADEVDAAITAAKAANAPTLIACKTEIGHGAPTKAGSAASHGAPLGADEIAGARAALDWPHGPFEIPDDILSAWRAIGARGGSSRGQWEENLSASPKGATFRDTMAGDFETSLGSAINQHKQEIVADNKKVATRKASQATLDVINATVEQTIGGSADLTGSNNTKTSDLTVLDSDNYAGRYVNYGIREHGMAAAMNGMALHGGIVPYGGTFMVFTDYCRPSIRMAALMGQRVIYVMTHDSIGLGEDGPTHQPVEHLAALRAIPNLNVYRPCDAIETAECWQLAMTDKDTPSVIALTRQGLVPARTTHSDENLCAKGAYVIAGGDKRHATVIATGSEVELAIKAREILAEDGVELCVVTAPCFEQFAAQSDEYIHATLGTEPRIGIEAAISQGWGLILRRKDHFIGMTGFGASAPAPDLYKHFGITADAIVLAVREQLN